MYLSQLDVKKTNQSDNLANDLDLTFITKKKMGNVLPSYMTNVITSISTFSFIHSYRVNIPFGPSYDVYTSQLISWNFRHPHKMLVKRLVSH